MTPRAIVIGLVVLLVVVAVLGYTAGWFQTGQEAMPINQPPDERVVPGTEQATPVPE